jgi:nucleotide-binding universal stress UspA family protein
MASESGSHSRKFLVIVDDTPECRVAIYFASRRARRTDGRVALLYVIPPGDFQHWQAVEEVMRDEAREEAEQILQDLAEEVKDVSGHLPEMIIREGQTREQIQALIKEDPGIEILVLGAATGKKNPGPLIGAIATGGFVEDPDMRLVPLTIVPGSLTRKDIDALT